MRTHRRRAARRRTHHTVGALLLAIAGAGTSITLLSEQAASIGAAVAARAEAARPVSINRKVPSVSAPPARPVFSADPTAAEITRARVFAEPLVALGTPSAGDNRALAQAISVYAEGAKLWAIEPFAAFLREHPSSAWRASLLTNLGNVHRASGYYTRALKTWAEAWELSKDDSSAHGRAVADMSAAGALDLLATLGHRPGLDRWLERTKAREMRGPAAAKATRARETRAFIAAHPERVIASGPKALEMLLQWRTSGARLPPRDAPPPVPAVLKTYRHTAAGTSLDQLRALASQVGLSMTAVRREPGVPFVTPAIVHLGFDHFSAVLEEIDGRFRVRDPALGGEVWLPREALDEETTGYALVPAEAVAPGWRELSEKDAAAVVGHSCPAGIPDPDECPCPESEPGMPTYSLHPTQASVLLSDAPLGYSPPHGPSVNLQLRYNHREENQPQIFPFTNLGPKWTLNWAAYLEEVPFTWYDNASYALPDHIAVHVPQGGVERYAFPDPQGDYGRHYRSAAVLVRVRSNPITYERRHADGSTEVYGLSDGGVPGTRRVFLTGVVDPHGQTLAFMWDAQLRLVAVTDALGQVTELHYDGADPLQVTSVTDPFGRVARFTYDAAGHLETVTDVINLTSRFLYSSGDFIAALQTPYGTTSFRAPTLTGEYNRAVEAMDPLGAVERVEFYWGDAPVPATAPPADVPAGFESRNDGLNTITSLHWAKGRNRNDVAEATAWRWLVYSLDWMWDPGWTIALPHTTKRPGEARTWYVYSGSTTRPSRVARKLADGTVSSVTATYNYQDNVTLSRDGMGRETTSTYAANGIDLLEVRNTTAGRNDLLASYANYTAGHLPQTSTDAAGQVTQTTYNAAGQVLTVTNARQETTTYTYDANGYLQSVTGPVPGATVSYTYDGYGRLRSATPAGEAAVVTEYDALNRPTRTTYADSTYEETTYSRLDVATRRDRAGRLTRFTYNAARQLVATQDPAGRVIQQQFCSCGALDALIDANGHATRWERDVAGRVIREVRADGVTATTYTYDSLGRLKTVTDPKQQVTTYTYHLDGSVASVVYTNAQIPTPSVSWSYHPAYPRVTTMVDGTGTTSYTYHPVGQLGAGQVATVDGPLANDVISYGYDPLGRVTTRAINGVPLTLSYDALGRVEQEVNALGTFGYTYDGVSGRLATVTYPNNQTSAYSYFPAAAEHRLQRIHHRYPNGATLSMFDYTYDQVGNIVTWRQQADTTAVIWDYGYDRVDQLTRAVKRATDPQGTLLQRFAYGYDPAGNRLFEQIDDTVTTWTYDRLNRLQTQQAGGLLRVAGTTNEPATVHVQGQPAAIDPTGVFVGGVQVAPGTTRFTVTARDAAGNTATQQYDVDQAGPSKVFTFDANGNLTSDGTRIFEWDARNQLMAVNAGSQRSEFTYDGVHRRVRIVEKHDAIVERDSTVIWCQTGVCEERIPPMGGVVNRVLAYGLDSAAGDRYFTHDHLGSIRESVDSFGAVVQRLEYDPYGRTTADPAYAAFAGHPQHPATGLYFALYRQYQPETAQWLSDDPIGLAGGPNLRAYVAANPVKLIDPLGLQNANTWTYGEIRQYAVTSMRNFAPPPGLGDAKASIAEVCTRNSCLSVDGSNATTPADRAAWRNITEAEGTDQSGGGNFMCVGTEACWFVSKCNACRSGTKTLVSRSAPLTASGRVTVGRNTIYFYNDPLLGWCNAADKNSGCKCQ